MIQHILVTGEGPTDIGYSITGQDISTNDLGADDEFCKGPFYRLLERMLLRFMPNWNSDQYDEANPISTSYVSHGYLSRRSKELAKGNKKFRFAGKDMPKGFTGLTKQSTELAKLATALGCQMAFYFHDTDGNNQDKSSVSRLQEKMVNAAKQGFVSGGFENCIAMVPKPTSEAWLICSCKDNAYDACGNLERTLSGNDDSPPEQSPKLVLENIIGAAYTDPILHQKIEELDIGRMDMPSFNQFRDDMKQAIRNICGEFEELQ
jgi:hypothetical protein|tara:strand:+ start:615 stop:1403 length:789 start_codon:yes stop_codon:yes gene_type:complete